MQSKTTVFRRKSAMEQIEFDYPAAKRSITKRAHVGVVGSGDMEVLMEPTQSEGAHVSITTSVDGYQSTWKAVFDRFFSKFDGAVRIQPSRYSGSRLRWKAVFDRFFSKFDGAVRVQINDAGATPGSVMLRLEQAVEVINQ